MRTNKYVVACVMMVIAVMATWVLTGCESAEGTSRMSISPANPILNGSSSNSNVVVFTAGVKDSLSLPLQWSVSDPALGNILSASGSNATYMANSGKKGDNVVTVRDQYASEGSAVVTQK